MRPRTQPLSQAVRGRALALSALAVVLLATLVASSTGSPAGATFPGANGKIAYSTSEAVMAVNPDGSGATPIGGPTDQLLSWSADGTKIAFASHVNDIAAIFTMNADGTNREQLTFTDMPETAPTWSPDGTKIAFESARDGYLTIYVMNADGTGQHRITPLGHHSMLPSWSPDGTRIAFVRALSGPIETISLMDPDGTNVVDITPNGSWSSVNWSPDGTKLIMSLTVDGLEQLHTMDANGTDLHRLTSSTHDSGPFWSPDGTKIAFTSQAQGPGYQPHIVYVADVDGTNRMSITPPTQDAFAEAWQPIPAMLGNPPEPTTTTSPTSSDDPAPLTPKFTG